MLASPCIRALGNFTGALGMDVLKLGFSQFFSKCCLKLFT